MIAKIFVSFDSKQIENETNQILTDLKFHQNHPDFLMIESNKLNLEQAKQIKDFFTFKPQQAQGRVVIIKYVLEASTEAQNALLKTIEELPKQALIIIGTSQETNFLPTILSRCEIIKFTSNALELNSIQQREIEDFINSNIQDRFYSIEKIKDKHEFLLNLAKYFQAKLRNQNIENISKIKDFLEQYIEAEKWSRSNVNIRGILEYLSLHIPKN